MKTHPVEELVSIRDVVRWAASEFARGKIWFGHGADNAWDEALLLVLTELGLALELESEVLEARLTRRERQRLLDLVARRVSERLPVAYLTGEAWFAGLPFHVSPAVLVPRSPIAELIEQGFQPWLDREPARILDLCTGSGCIGIACAMAFPDAEVVLAGLSPGALEIARRNLERHGLGQRVRGVASDLFEALGGGGVRPHRQQSTLCRRRGPGQHASRIPPRAEAGAGRGRGWPGPGASPDGRSGRPPERRGAAGGGGGEQRRSPGPGLSPAAVHLGGAGPRRRRCVHPDEHRAGQPCSGAAGGAG